MRTPSLCAAFALAVLCLSAQDRMTDAFRKGIVEEETNRDLKAAIQSYQTVLARYGEDRKTAATALFRIAECYRKLGNSKEAIAAYSRVVRDFAEQTKLADQSRSLLAKTYHLPEQNAGPVDPDTANARSLYRGLLLQEIQAFHQHVAFVQRKYELGAASTADVDRAKADLAVLESRVAAFDAGLVPQAPAGSGTPAALAAGAQYRALLQRELNYAERDLEAAQHKYELGTLQPQDMLEARIRVIEAQLKVAALLAGLAPAPSGAVPAK